MSQRKIEKYRLLSCWQLKNLPVRFLSHQADCKQSGSVAKLKVKLFGFDLKHFDKVVMVKKCNATDFLMCLGNSVLDHYTLRLIEFVGEGGRSRCNRMVEESANISGHSPCQICHNQESGMNHCENCSIAKFDYFVGKC